MRTKEISNYLPCYSEGRMKSQEGWELGHMGNALGHRLPPACQLLPRELFTLFSPLVITIVLKCAVTRLFSVKSKVYDAKCQRHRENSLEFVLLINEENNDLYVPAWTGRCSLLVAAWREGRSLDVPLRDWGKRGCIEDSESLAGLKIAVQWKAMTEEALDWFGGSLHLPLSSLVGDCSVQ